MLRLIDRGEAHVATNTTDPMPDGLYWGMNISLDGLARGDGEVTWLMREEIIEMKKHAVRLEDQRQCMISSPRKSWREALGSGFLSTFGFGGGIDRYEDGWFDEYGDGNGLEIESLTDNGYRDGTGNRTWYGVSTNEASKRNMIHSGTGRLNDNGDDPINGYPGNHERSRKNDRNANWFGHT